MSGVLVFHGLTSLVWLYEQRVHGSGREHTSLMPGITSWLGEALAMFVAVAAWPLGLWRPRIRSGRGPEPPVALVTGWPLNRGALLLLEARLRRDGRDAYAIDYAHTRADPDRTAAGLAAAVRSLAARTGAATIEVVAHGQAGVLARAAARDHGLNEIVSRLVTLGSPHQGAALAALSSMTSFRHLIPGARFLERLRDNDASGQRPAVVAIHSPSDTIVFPHELAQLPGALNVSVENVGHMGMLLSEKIYRLVRENLEAMPADDDASTARPA
jgi:pimeloyl-ACP methyl ester carboxylesterase